MDKKVCAVVVTYNRLEKLKKCVECILNQELINCDVVIVDNDSSDGTGDFILSEYKGQNGIHYFNTGKNLGGAGGFEFGVCEAVKKGYEYVWIMDDDTWPEKNALQELLKADEELDGNWGFLSSVAYWTDQTICRMNIQKKGIFRHIGKKEYLRNISEIKMCSFVSLLVKSSVVKELGLPIGDYFIWTDDYEFTGRISRKHPCYMVSGSHVIHAMENHTRVNFATDSSDRIERYKYIYRNDVHCYRQYGIKGWLYIVSKDCYTALDVMFNSKKEKLHKIKVIFQGFIEGLNFYPEIKNISTDGNERI